MAPSGVVRLVPSSGGSLGALALDWIRARLGCLPGTASLKPLFALAQSLGRGACRARYGGEGRRRRDAPLCVGYSRVPREYVVVSPGKEWLNRSEALKSYTRQRDDQELGNLTWSTWLGCVASVLAPSIG